MVTRRLFGALLICCSIVIAQGGIAVADDYRTIENSSPQEVVNGMMTKAARGLANMATGWVELPKQIYTTSVEDGTARGIFIGPFKGLGMMLVRTMAGAGELLTFYVAYPGFYDPYFDPGFVWEKE